MTDHSDDDQRKREQRQRDHQQLREMLGQALVAHTMTDEESYEAMLVIAVDDAFAESENTERDAPLDNPPCRPLLETPTNPRARNILD